MVDEIDLVRSSNSCSTMCHLINNHRSDAIKDCLESYLKNKHPDVILHSEDGTEFKTHKVLLGQTKFMRKLLKSSNCCGIIEIICPCSKEELDHLLFEFVNHGKIHCNEKLGTLKILENLNKVFGFLARAGLCVICFDQHCI